MNWALKARKMRAGYVGIRIGIAVFTFIILSIVLVLVMNHSGDSLWSEVTSPDYARISAKMTTDDLYDQYQRDMDLRPEVDTLSTVLAQRGRPVAITILDRIRYTNSAKEVSNAVFVFREMRRLGTLDICLEPALYRQLVIDSERTRLVELQRPAVYPENLCRNAY